MKWHTAGSNVTPNKPGNYLAVVKGGELTVVTFKWFSMGPGAVQHPWWSRNIVAWAELPTDVPDFSNELDWATLQSRPPGTV